MCLTLHYLTGEIMAGMEKFTQRARRVLSMAHEEAERARQGLIGTEHLLLARHQGGFGRGQGAGN